MSNVVEVVGADINLATMSRGVKAAGLDVAFAGKGPFTIFAPTDIAFGKLQAGRMQELLKAENKEKLAELLNHHVVDGLNNYNDLKHNQKLVTVNGRQLNVVLAEGKVMINGAVVQGRDSEGTNGVVHSLDTVIEMN